MKNKRHIRQTIPETCLVRSLSWRWATKSWTTVKRDVCSPSRLSKLKIRVYFFAVTLIFRGCFGIVFRIRQKRVSPATADIRKRRSYVFRFGGMISFLVVLCFSFVRWSFVYRTYTGTTMTNLQYWTRSVSWTR